MMKINDQKEKRVIQAEIILDHTHKRGLEYEKVQFNSAQKFFIQKKLNLVSRHSKKVSRYYLTIFIEFFVNFLSLCILSRTEASTNSLRIKACFFILSPCHFVNKCAMLRSFHSTYWKNVKDF